MLEYQGWIIIEEDPSGDLPEGKSFDSRASAIIEKIDLLRRKYGAAIAHYGINGNYRITLCGASNRKDTRFYEIVKLYEGISLSLPGSYGILYYLDTEDEQYWDVYRCLILRKGRITTEIDNFFSPVSEKVESEDIDFVEPD